MSVNPAYASGGGDDTESESHEHTGVSDEKAAILHMINGQEWGQVLQHLSGNEELAQLPLRASSNELLLHYVCKANAPVELIKTVLQANEKAVGVGGNSGFLPLHYACANGASIAVMEVLLDAFPGAVKMCDTKKNRLPLHLAARRESEETAEVLALLMSYFPEATMAGDINGLRPLDYAANSTNPNKKTRWEIISVLEMGQKWIRVGQNVTQRLEQDFAERLRNLERDLGGYVESLKAVHDEDIARFANDMLDLELDGTAVVADGKESTGSFQSKLDELVEKYEKYLDLQEESRAVRLEIQDATSIEQVFSQDQSEFEPSNTAEESDRINAAKAEEQISAREKELLARIATLEKSERLKAGIIKRIIVMANEKEKRSQKNIMDLVNVIDEQEAHIAMLMSKLDLCEEQLSMLKGSLRSATKA
jgi:hypothetical protein